MTQSQILYKKARRQRPLLLGVVVVLILMLGGLALIFWRSNTRAARAPGLPIATLSAGDFHALAFLPAKEEVVLFGHHNGIMISRDGGRTWKSLVEQRGFDAMSLVVRDTNPVQIAAAGHHNFQASWDGGITWQPINHNLPSNDMHALVMNPDNPAQLTVYVAEQGLFSSQDGGRTWDRLREEPHAVNDTMVLASGGGSPERLYLGTLRSGLYGTQDGGKTWIKLAPNVEFGSILSLAVDPLSRGTLYAGTDQGLLKSEDAGLTWERLPYPGQNAAVVTLHPRRPSTLLAISVTEEGTGSLYRSDDGGENWLSAR